MAERNYYMGFYDIGICFEPRVVRVVNHEELKQFLLQRGKGKVIRQARRVAGFALKGYQRKFGEELKISKKSLTMEIAGHFALQEMSKSIEGIIGSNKWTRWMQNHMDVIDCGEKAIDNNRFIWDFLAFLG